jgi:hypothetical protein
MQPDANTPLILTLNLEMVNTVIGALSVQPYEKVAGIIAAIQQQAISQLQPAPKVEAEAAE